MHYRFMVCEFYKYPVFCEGNGIIWDSKPEIIEIKNENHVCMPNISLARLNMACFEGSQTSVGQPHDLITAVFERLALKFQNFIIHK